MASRSVPGLGFVFMGLFLAFLLIEPVVSGLMALVALPLMWYLGTAPEKETEPPY